MADKNCQEIQQQIVSLKWKISKSKNKEKIYDLAKQLNIERNRLREIDPEIYPIKWKIRRGE